ncbi:MAG: apolipoprotein N-acyltransferase, partial [Nitrospirae bacterium]
MNHQKTVYKYLFLSALSAVIIQAAYPPLRLWPVGYVALMPFFYALLKNNNHRPSLTGLCFGWVFFFLNQFWIYHSLHYYGGMPSVSATSAVMVLSFYESLYLVVFSFMVSRLYKRGIPFIMFAPFFWTSLEFLRGHLLTGFPWSLMGYTQTGYLPELQISDITSIYGVSFLVVMVNAGLTEAVLLIKQGRYRKGLIRVLMVLMALSLSTGYGYYRINQIRNLSAEKTLSLSLIQGNIEQDVKWNPEYQEEVLDTYLKLTEEAVKEYHPELVVWPESALPFYYGSEPELTERLNNFVKEIKTPLLTGSMLVRGVEFKGNEVSDYRVTNSAILIDTNGKLTYIYDKIHLVPFGEYVPLRRFLFFFDKIVPVGIGDFTRGTSFVKGDVKGLRFCTVICFEAAFPELVRGFFTDGGDLIFNITNDGWFGRTTGPLQHFDIALVRAVEERKPLIRVANTGISAIVDQTGRVTKRLGLFKRAALSDNIEIKRIVSFYTKHGDIFSYICLI